MRDLAQSRPPAVRIARWISIVGHPFVLLPVAIVLGRRDASGASSARVLGAVAIGFAAVAVHVARERRHGRIANIDVSDRTQRPKVYAIAIACTLGAAAMLHFLGEASSVVRGALVSCALLAVSAVLNRWIKVSLHASFAVFAAFMLFGRGAAWGFAGLVIALLVAWSRIAYERHTPREVATGLALGGVFGALLWGLA